MSEPNNVIRLAVSNPIATYEQLAATDFEASPEFIKFGQNREAIRTLENNLWQHLRISLIFAASVMGLSKADLIAMVRRMGEEWPSEALAENLHRDLTSSREQLESHLAVITAAEIRLAVAMANACDGIDDGSAPPP
jgi:hypothetical protein